MSAVEQPKNLFEDFMGSVADAVRPAEFNTWFSKVSGSADGGKIILRAPSDFVAGCIKNRYKSALELLAAEMKLGLEIGSRMNSAAAEAANINDNKPAVASAPAPRPETDSYSFENFITSAENEFVVAACKKLSAANVGFSPLFLYGASGCGKTHLARAVRNEIVLGGDRSVVMLSGDRFVSDFVRSLKNQTNFAFKDKIASADVLIIDGVESLIGKSATLAEFESLLVSVIENGGNVVLTASQAPGALSGISRRLQSLLSSGVVADVASPNAAAKMRILKTAGATDEVARFVAENSACDGHVVAGLAKKISVWCETFGMKMTLDESRRVLGDSLNGKKSPEDFVKKMCAALAVSFDEIMSARRQAKIVRARQMMMHVLKSETNMSLSEIGRALGGKDHATIIYGINNIEKQKLSDLTLTAELETLRAAMN
ncbi:MAG: AAA family ATPase [Rickettsiales bacterium]|jgi:chromosomal replication initiator protein|nr:AAA family ATPase [Rickettsiales bacterium]